MVVEGGGGFDRADNEKLGKGGIATPFNEVKMGVVVLFILSPV